MRLADVRAGTDAKSESCGSGYLIGPRLVLTARHVVADAAGVWPRIEVRVGHPGSGAPVRAGAHVCWPLAGDGSRAVDYEAWDVALLELDREVESNELVRWGRPVGGTPQAYTGLGYPLLADYEDGGRGVEQLGGMLPPLATGADGGFVLDQQVAPRLRASGERAWSGVSGAPVFCAGLLVGVVVKDDEEFENRRLHATPVWRFASDLQFADLVRKHAGTSPVIEPVELAGLLDTRALPVTAHTPGSLLSAAAETVSFHSREDELAMLATWRDSGPRLSVMLLAGEGGQGKSRLAREFLRASRTAHWVAGMAEPARAVDERKARKILDRQLQTTRAQQLLEQLRTCTTPTLIVCDYAEVHPVFVETLLDGLAEHPLLRPVRVLLLSRTRGAWWQDVEGLLGNAATCLELKALNRGRQARREAYVAAVSGLAKGLAGLPEPPIGQEPAAPWPTLANQLASDPPNLETGGNALTLQMIALLDLLRSAAGTAPTAAEGPEHRLVEHERDYLRRAAAAKGLLGENVLSTATDRARRERQALRALDRSLAAVILFGPCDLNLAQQVGCMASADHADDVVDWLSALYPPTPGQGLSVGSVQPDRLAEYLLGEILTDADQHHAPVHADLLPRLGALAADLDTAQTALFTLVRTAAHPPFHTEVAQSIAQLLTQRPDPFATAAVFLAAHPAHRQLLLGGLHQLAQYNRGALFAHAERANRMLPKTSVSLAFFSAAITATLTELFAHLAGTDRDFYLPVLALALNNHATRLAQTGRREDALPVSEEAVQLYRDLVRVNRDAHLPELAMALNNHAKWLAQTGRREDALPVSEEAVQLRRDLVRVNRDAHLPELAMALNNHAAMLTETGRREDALPVSEEAVQLRRELVRVNRDAHLPELAMALNNHAVQLARVGRREEALPLSEQGVQFYRELVRVNRDAHLPELAMALNNHAARLSGVGRTEEALPVSEEALQLRRELVRVNRDAYLPDLAMALNNHAKWLAGVGRVEEALPLSEEALQLRRELVRVNRDAHLPDLGMSLQAAAWLAGAEGREEALQLSEEAVQVWRELVRVNRDAHLPDLAMSLSNHAVQLADVGRREEALQLSEEAVQVWRELVRVNRDAHLPDLAMSLSNHAVQLADVGRREEALQLSEQAVQFYRDLARVNRDAHLPNLIRSLTACGYAQLQLSRFRETIKPLVEALMLLQSLTAYPQDIVGAITGFLRTAFASDPVGVAEEFRAITGAETPAWMQEPPGGNEWWSAGTDGHT
ncbi:tetratricopeptide repeat protein [Streptomyces sp. NPDC023998]|uniref:tetratricopeptide repeat protein n=1 Tax=Streptomyces sp. NPDC023998 TaxID=3154597 RepID=UPI00340631CE